MGLRGLQWATTPLSDWVVHFTAVVIFYFLAQDEVFRRLHPLRLRHGVLRINGFVFADSSLHLRRGRRLAKFLPNNLPIAIVNKPCLMTLILRLSSAAHRYRSFRTTSVAWTDTHALGEIEEKDAENVWLMTAVD